MTPRKLLDRLDVYIKNRKREVTQKTLSLRQIEDDKTRVLLARDAVRMFKSTRHTDSLYIERIVMNELMDMMFDGMADIYSMANGDWEYSHEDVGEIGGMTYVNTYFLAEVNKDYLVDTSTGAVEATLPNAPSPGDEVTFIDYMGTFGVNNLTILPNGNQILGQNGGYTIDSSRITRTLRYVDDVIGWIVY